MHRQQRNLSNQS